MTGFAILPRPLRVKPAFVRNCIAGAIVCFAAGGAIAIGGPVWQAAEAQKLLGDQALWKSGALAADVRVSGRETSHNFLLNSYNLDVSYADAVGAEHKTTIEFDTLFASVDQQSPVDARYDPKQPERVALSWAVDMVGSRWASIAFLGLGSVALGLLFAWLGRLALRRLADARQVGSSFEEIDVPLVRVIEMKQYGRSTGQMRYQFQVVRADGKTKTLETSFNRKKKQEPIFVDAERTRMLAVRTTHAPDRPIVLRNDFHPFDVSETDRAASLARLERRRGQENL
jgi:hypothetical protein